MAVLRFRLSLALASSMDWWSLVCRTSRDGHEQATVHAEQNAVADAARRGSSVEGCVAYVTHYPCINCAKILAAAGISAIRFHEDYHNDPLVAPILKDAGVKIKKL